MPEGLDKARHGAYLNLINGVFSDRGRRKRRTSRKMSSYDPKGGAFPPDLRTYRALLRERFGYPDFRDGQKDVLELLSKSDVLAVMPTGSGKSLCYTLPALVVGRTVVVSPLIALMQDQVDSLRAFGVKAAFINSSLDRSEQNRRYVDFVNGRLDLLYVAPERFANERFVTGLARAGVSLFAIDEAHCVSEWGHDFRPDYLTLDLVRQRLGSPRTLALTGTADPRVRRDIVERLGTGPRTALVVTSVDRPNLKFTVEHISGVAEREHWLLSFLKARSGQSGMVYARTRRGVEDIAAALEAAGIPAAAYHAGMPRDVRARVQRQFTLDQVPVIVATNAFGLGIDKPDVRFVVHFNMPGRIESYYQEAGRGGRDGDSAECTLLFSSHDEPLQERFIDKAHPDDGAVRATWQRWVEACLRNGDAFTLTAEISRSERDGFAATLAALRASGLVEPATLRLTSLDPDAPIDTSSISAHRRYAEERLSQMVEYAESSECRRAMILRYFGEHPASRCNACDTCLGERTPTGAEYQPDLYDAIIELRQLLAPRYDREPDQIFRARTARDLAAYRPNNREELLETWGIGDIKADWFGDRVLGVIRRWEDEHPGARARLAQPASQRTLTQETGPEVSPDDPLYQSLRSWRLSRAQQENVPAFIVFSDHTLRELAGRRPKDLAALRLIWGLGDHKVDRWGQEVLAVISTAP